MPKKPPKKSRDSKRDPTDRLLVALGHPLRRRILEALMREPASASTLARQFGMKDKLGVISYHLCKALFQECDVVEIVAIHPRRGAYEKVFAIKPEALLFEFRPVGVDADGRREIAEAAEKLAETTSAVAARCSGSEPAELTQLVVGTAVFEAARASSQEAA